jgi:hypothetical protein
LRRIDKLVKDVRCHRPLGPPPLTIRLVRAFRHTDSSTIAAAGIRFFHGVGHRRAGAQGTCVRQSYARRVARSGSACTLAKPGCSGALLRLVILPNAFYMERALVGGLEKRAELTLWREERRAWAPSGRRC